MPTPTRARERVARLGALVIVATLATGIAVTINQIHDNDAADARRAQALARLLRDAPTPLPTAVLDAALDPDVLSVLSGLRDRIAALSGQSITIPAPRIVITTTTAPYPGPPGPPGPAGAPGTAVPVATSTPRPAPSTSPTPPCRLALPLLGLCLDLEGQP